ncbi:MAG TPA: hypothetical protein VK063_02375 [Beutenbergiaceae bacterium]|nr:hypothetical protein [Beutenbergiaceae bacterium]
MSRPTCAGPWYHPGDGVEVMLMRWLRFTRPVNADARRAYERALRRRAQHQEAAQLMLR